MIYNSILIGVDEIWVKSEKVKNKLMKELHKIISNSIGTNNILVGRGRIFIFDYKEEWIYKLQKIFGIKTIYPAYKIKTDLEEIKLGSKLFFENFNGSFKIVTKRVWKNFRYTSPEVNKIVGEYLCKNFGLKVDLKNPDKVVYIEIHDFATFLYDKVFYGPGGFPLGFQGKGILLFSGGVDSSVAAYLIGKRGLDLDFLFINIGGKSYLRYIYRIFNKLKEYFPDSKLYVYDFDIEKLFKVRKGYRQIIYKAIMYKIAEEFCKSKNYLCIVTGESLGQVSTQTIYSIKCLDKIIDFTVFRPLLGFNKDEIISIAKSLGFYDYRAPEICEIEKHPKAKPDCKIFFEELNKLDINFKEEINKIYELTNLEENLEYEVDLPDKENLIVIDVRNFDKITLEKDKKYLFVCPTGILAKKFYEKYKNEYNVYYLDIKTAKLLGYL